MQKSSKKLKSVKTTFKKLNVANIKKTFKNVSLNLSNLFFKA